MLSVLPSSPVAIGKKPKGSALRLNVVFVIAEFEVSSVLSTTEVSSWCLLIP